MSTQLAVKGCRPLTKQYTANADRYAESGMLSHLNWLRPEGACTITQHHLA